nr:glutaminase A [Bacillus sp. Marseille-P3661]
MFQQSLEEFITEAKRYIKDGKVAKYIPALERADANDLAIAIYEQNGAISSAGDVSNIFTLQSVSKILSLAVAIMDHGKYYVFQKVGMEPTGDPFNSISKLETSVPSKPLNPMINAGALAVTSMIKGESVQEKIHRILLLVRKMANNDSINYSSEVAKSEYDTAYLNRSLCYFLKQHGIISGDIEQLMDLYTKQCAISVNCIDLARIGAVFAFDGQDPESKEQMIEKDIARICKTFMVTCGMYNASGEFATKVGIPAKSGVSGAILGSVPHKFGIGIYGPALDDKGNSIAGVELLRLLSKRHELSIF